jgi:hypothetical protein
MAEYYISGIGIFGSGLFGWPASSGMLAGKDEYELTEQPKLAPALLPAAVRRRAGSYIRLAAEVADEAVKNSTMDASQLASVFTTSESDGKITDAICRAVCEAEPAVSPTMFHNSVTNAPAGYWCMAVNSMKPSTSIAGQVGSFSIGLIEACLQIETEANDTLLVCHDVTMPHPLNKVARVDSDFGVALVLTKKQQASSLAAISWQLVANSAVLSEVGIEAIDKIGQGNAAGRCLPLMKQIAIAKNGDVILPYSFTQHLQVTINPCC